MTARHEALLLSVLSLMGCSLDPPPSEEPPTQSCASALESGEESRNIEFEKIKVDMQKTSQMQQSLSGVLNAMQRDE